jgi:amino acid permease
MEAPEGNTSVAQTYFNMFKCFIGIGILATPSAIRQVGLVGGALGIIFCGIVNMYTAKLQLHCQNKVGKHITSYSELGMAILGPRGKTFVDFCMTIS